MQASRCGTCLNEILFSDDNVTVQSLKNNEL